MRKTNKKGFTIVELVIVIAVIAILAAVMIPTFAGVIDTANQSKALQVAQAAYKEAYALAVADGKIATDDDAGTETHTVSGYTFTFVTTDESTSIKDLSEVTVTEVSGTDINEDGYHITVDAKTGAVTVSSGEATSTTGGDTGSGGTGSDTPGGEG